MDRQPGRKRESEMGQKCETGEHEMRNDKRMHRGERDQESEREPGTEDRN